MEQKQEAGENCITRILILIFLAQNYQTDQIRVDFEDTVCGDLGWIHLTQDHA
jgi:hypothetical protein